MWSRFNPSALWGQMKDLQSEVNRVFDRAPSEWFRTEPSYPALNLWEDTDAYHLEAELPGQSLEDLEIFVTGMDQFTIKGERKVPSADGQVQHRQERGFGKYVRTVTLPGAVDAEKVEAKLEHGILSVRLPKHERAKPRKIDIRS